MDPSHFSTSLYTPVLSLITEQEDLTHSEDATKRFNSHCTPQNSVSGYNASRLPKLSIPMFSGDPLIWQPFWDSFDAAINLNPVLSNVQKFNYLRAQLQGNAARVISGFPLTNDHLFTCFIVGSPNLLCSYAGTHRPTRSW